MKSVNKFDSREKIRNLPSLDNDADKKELASNPIEEHK